MARKKTIIKWSLITLAGLIAAVTVFGFWFMSLLGPAPDTAALAATTPKEIPYLTTDSIANRGKILAVVTSCAVMGSSGKATGYELSELARAYYVFMHNGFEVEVASPLGGKPPEIRDDDDMGLYDYAFLNDPAAQHKVKHTIAMKDVDPEDYAAVYFVGGKGAMFDFPDNKYIQQLVREYYTSGKVIGAVCHGPSALVNVTMDDGKPMLVNKTVCGFTNEEELFLIPEAPDIFPFLLQDKLAEQGARFDEGFLYLENVVQDGNLVTGQNPWSTWSLAETMIRQMGYAPKKRAKTDEENAVTVLKAYTTSGYGHAKQRLTKLYLDEQRYVNRELIAIHGIVAAMQWDLGKAVDLIRLLAYAKSVY